MTIVTRTVMRQGNLVQKCTFAGPFMAVRAIHHKRSKERLLWYIPGFAVDGATPDVFFLHPLTAAG
ncbi:hypothetical protein N1I81_22715 [Bacillus sp. FSL M8-0052]|uniref:hypothetical protein n=1 Tax=Bacillus sp. FSL M8-0052 TaxID=2978203 RepID=UPI0030FA094A